MRLTFFRIKDKIILLFFRLIASLRRLEVKKHAPYALRQGCACAMGMYIGHWGPYLKQAISVTSLDFLT